MSAQRKTRWLILCVMGILHVSLPWSSIAAKMPISVLVQNLKSSTWTIRAQSYAELRDDPAAMSQLDVRRALVDLLDREDDLIVATLRESHGEDGVSVKYGEAYSEYVDQLGDTVDAFADWTDRRQVCILVRQSYDVDSVFARKVASRGNITFPCLAQMFGSDVGIIRGQAASMTVLLVSASQSRLSPQQKKAALAILRRATHDHDPVVQFDAINTMGAVGSPEMLPILTELSRSEAAAKDNSLAKLVSRAVSRIQARAPVK